MPEYADTIADARYTGIIERAVDTLTARLRIVSPETARTVLRQAVHHARQRAYEEIARETGRAMAAQRAVVTRQCDRCGTEFTGTGKRRYCSDACKSAAYRGRKAT